MSLRFLTPAVPGRRGYPSRRPDPILRGQPCRPPSDPEIALPSLGPGLVGRFPILQPARPPCLVLGTFSIDGPSQAWIQPKPPPSPTLRCRTIQPTHPMRSPYP